MPETKCSEATTCTYVYITMSVYVLWCDYYSEQILHCFYLPIRFKLVRVIFRSRAIYLVIRASIFLPLLSLTYFVHLLLAVTLVDLLT